jgi:hypothetical protein
MVFVEQCVCVALLYLRLWPLRSILGTRLSSIVNTQGVLRTTYNMVPHTRKVLYTTTAKQNNRVLLKIVTNARYIRRHLDAVRQSNTSYLTKRRVRLLGGDGHYPRTNATLLRTRVQRRRFGSFLDRFSTLSDQLIYSWHAF